MPGGIISQNRREVTQAGSQASEHSVAGRGVRIDWGSGGEDARAILGRCLPEGVAAGSRLERQGHQAAGPGCGVLG